MFESCLKDDNSLVWSRKAGTITPIHVAVEYGKDWFVKELVEVHNVDINLQCTLTGYSPLMYAC